jgi:hypothetical protein
MGNLQNMMKSFAGGLGGGMPGMGDLAAMMGGGGAGAGAGPEGGMPDMSEMMKMMGSMGMGGMMPPGAAGRGGRRR